MLVVVGLVLLALGIFSGAVLVLAPLGILQAAGGLTLWVLFPLFTILGYLLAAAPTDNANLPMLSKVSGVLLVLLALVSAAILVLQAASMIEPQGNTMSLWYVLVLGLLLGGSGLASTRRMAGT